MDDNKPTSSKYFKPGYIFNKESKTKVDEELLDDDLDDDDIEEVISQASQRLKTDKQITSTQDERLNLLDSQPVDFISVQKNTLPSLKGTSVILINSTQKENPLLKYLRYCRYVISDSIAPAHYVLSDNCCALFLSLKYHRAKSEKWIYEQVSKLRNKYQLSLLILLIDQSNFEKDLKELTLMSIRANFTLLLAWSFEEAAKHIENYRMNSEKSPDIIMGKSFDDHSTKSNNASKQQGLIDALSSVKRINRTDAISLLSTFDTFENLVNANIDELTFCSGISMVKAKQLDSIFNKPFIRK